MQIIYLKEKQINEIEGSLCCVLEGKQLCVGDILCWPSGANEVPDLYDYVDFQYGCFVTGRTKDVLAEVITGDMEVVGTLPEDKKILDENPIYER